MRRQYDTLHVAALYHFGDGNVGAVILSDDLTKEQARSLLEHLDVPDCGCPRVPLDCGHDYLCDCPVLLPPPCEHILATWHDLTFAEWARLCLLAFPVLYRYPKDPTVPSQEILRHKRVAVYVARRKLKLGLWHEKDRWRKQPTNDRDMTGPRAQRLDNGYLDPHQRLASQRVT